MKKVLGCAFLVSVLAIPLVSSAADFRFGKQTSIEANETVATNAYLGGGSVVSAGPVSGDVLAGGGNVFVNGAVGGDVFAGGGNVIVLSNVVGDVRVGGGTVITQGKIGGDLIAGGGQVTVGGPGIGGDAAIGGGSVRIDAPIAGNARIAGNDVYLNAPIKGDIFVQANTLTLGKSAVISGNLSYKASKELVKEDGAIVNGHISFEPRVEQKATAVGIAAIISIWVLMKFLALFVCALIVGLTFKRYSKAVIKKAAERPWFEIGKGLVAFIVFPVASILCLVTLVGIPFGILGLFGFAVTLIFMWIMMPIVVGSVIYRYFTKRELEVSWKTVLLGAFVCIVLGIIPFIGWFMLLLISLLSLGAIVTVEWEIWKEWR
ncbi:MAG: hypothetical protein NTU85_02580 [Candidatus Kaiserbacteria bacterium]|nr:hypothetical protein [Candidatus Kaiserbacteria bacterium]